MSLRFLSRLLARPFRMTAAPTPLETAALDALRQLPDPLTGQDWVSARRVRQLKVADGRAEVNIVLGYPARSQWPAGRA